MAKKTLITHYYNYILEMTTEILHYYEVTTEFKAYRLRLASEPFDTTKAPFCEINDSFLPDLSIEIYDPKHQLIGVAVITENVEIAKKLHSNEQMLSDIFNGFADLMQCWYQGDYAKISYSYHDYEQSRLNNLKRLEAFNDTILQEFLNHQQVGKIQTEIINGKFPILRGYHIDKKVN